MAGTAMAEPARAEPAMAEPADVLAETFRTEWPRLVSAAMRLLGDLQAAEDVVQDVLVSALDRWPLSGVPANPAAWLMTSCRNRALNRIRDQGRARDRTAGLAARVVPGRPARRWPPRRPGSPGCSPTCCRRSRRRGRCAR